MIRTNRTNKDLHPLHRISRRLTSLSEEGVALPEFLRTVLEDLLAPYGNSSAVLWLKEERACIRACLIHDGHEWVFEAGHAQGTGLEDVVRDNKVDASSGRVTYHEGVYYIPIGSATDMFGVMEIEIKDHGDLESDEIQRLQDSIQALGFAVTSFRSQSDLRERIKELTCLYGIARLADNPTIPIEELLRGIVEVLPPAWQYPDIASARIEVDGRSYTTSSYEAGPHHQTADIVVAGVRRGLVEVTYTREVHAFSSSPFLKWENHLINAVADQVAVIIERRHSENERQRLQEQLRHSDRLATIGQLTAGVAHELNEPLANILGFAQLALKGEGMPQQIASDIKRIETASLHAREVIRKLMFFSRQMPHRSTKVDLSQVVEDGLYFLSSRCTKGGVELIRELADELPDIMVDPSQVNQVLVNMVVNAVQSMPNGGTLTVKTAKDEDHALLIIEDTGHGMSKEVERQIFLPFFTTKDVDEGTGLGLAVVHGIIDSLGGDIDVKTQVGEGTRFTIRIPRVDKGGDEANLE